MTLYINSCIRKESRTARIAQALLNKLGQYDELKLSEMQLSPLNAESLDKRTKLLEEGKTEAPMFSLAKQFAEADTIVIAAPFWDGGFPAILKTYLENIYVTGIVSKYSEEGIPVGLCKASKLYYVTTAGGPYFPSFSYSYLEALAKGCFGIKETELIFAENLDIVGNDPDKIVEKTIQNIHL